MVPWVSAPCRRSSRAAILLEQKIHERARHPRRRTGGRIDGVPMPQDGEALNIEHRELPLVEREGVAGEGGDAEAGEDGLLDGFVAAEFQARVKGDAVFSARLRLKPSPRPGFCGGVPRWIVGSPPPGRMLAVARRQHSQRGRRSYRGIPRPKHRAVVGGPPRPDAVEIATVRNRGEGAAPTTSSFT